MLQGSLMEYASILHGQYLLTNVWIDIETFMSQIVWNNVVFFLTGKFHSF